MSRKTIETFYTAFARLDGAAMAACLQARQIALRQVEGGA